MTGARADVAAAQEDLRNRFGRSAADIAREPSEAPGLSAAWTALQEHLQVEKSLEEELLETAANSRYAMAVDKLPPHVQDTARRRWLERRRESQRR